MAATSPIEYENIQVTGPVSVERVDRVDGICWIILIMGPTGAGKSTFIEALGLRDTERISSNGLEGFTQTISTYRINNMTIKVGSVLYLVDSPGFADTKISEMAIVSMLQKWLEDNREPYFHQILYLTPITHVRLPGSQRQVLRTFEALTGVKSAQSVTIVTTMWDAIWQERARTQAEETYRQLETDIWKGFIENGAEMVKFYNTQESAVLVLDTAMRSFALKHFHIEKRSNRGTLRETTFAANLYTDHQNRIQNQELQLSGIRSDLEYAEAQDDQILLSVLRPRLEEAQKLLEKFQDELQEFESPPDPEPAHVEYPHPSVPNGLPSTLGTVPVPSAPQPQALDGAHAPLYPQRGRLSRALDFITGCACCGKGVEANHDA